MQYTVHMHCTYLQIWTALSNRDYTLDSNRSSSPPKHVSVLCDLQNKLTVYENPEIRDWIYAMLTFKTISFQI